MIREKVVKSVRNELKYDKKCRFRREKQDNVAE